MLSTQKTLEPPTHRMTVRLYYTDAYLTEFDAHVEERADDGRRVYLDRSAFYPSSGGQPFDTGTLDGLPVTDVVDEGERIAHVLAARLETEHPHARIDWERRFDHMQQHTGQHVLSAAFEDLFGHATMSVHFGQDVSTLDLGVPSLEAEEILHAARRANEIVLENRMVEVLFEDAAIAINLRKPPPQRGLLRIIEIPGVDRSACGGTHVRATGEIGPILLRKLDRVRKSVRVEFVCGLRALRRAHADFEALSAIAKSLSSSLEDAPAMVAGQAERLAEAERLRRRMSSELQAYRARSIYEAAQPDTEGVRRAVVRASAGETAEDLRGLAQEFSRLPRAVLTIGIAEPAGAMLAASEDSGLDASVILRAALERFDGRGGGSPRVAQGILDAADQLDAFVKELSDSGQT
jgi:alanyl-tRNA synthetase